MVETISLEGVKVAPIGVKIISVLYYIGAGLQIVIALLSMVGALLFSSLIKSQIPFLGFLGSGLLVLFAIFMMGFGILSFFIARGLWKLRPWARIIVIVFGILGVLGSIPALINDPLSLNLIILPIQGLIVAYLLFFPEAKEAFS